jgi:alkyl hydroperoxide reductase subunit D
MAMNNIWYPYVDMADDEDLKSQRPELRMNAYATFGGVSREKFEMYALSASIVGKCHFCIGSHYKLLKDHGITITQLRDIGRIAAVISAVSQITA